MVKQWSPKPLNGSSNLSIPAKVENTMNKEDKQKQDLNWVNILGSSKYYYIDDNQYKELKNNK